jgi:hypothetical protein
MAPFESALAYGIFGYTSCYLNAVDASREGNATLLLVENEKARS